MSSKLTAAAVERIKPNPEKRLEIPDGLLPGLYLIVQPTGGKSWAARYRYHGRPRKVTLGSYPALGLKEAREAARAALQNVAKGKDPAADRALQKAARPDTFEAVVADFIEKYAKKKTRSWRKTKRTLEREVVSQWGRRPIDSITRADVIDLLDSIMDEGKHYKANRVLGYVRKLFNWALERGIVETSPVANVSAPGKETRRDRVLGDDEIRAVWNGAEHLGYPFGGLVKMLLVTAQRREEVATMRWSHVDLDDAVWTLPREVTKSDRSHQVPLSPLALEILNHLPKMGEHLFSSGRRGDIPVSGYSVAKRRLDKLSGVADWRLHDLRRTAASGMAQLNTAPHVLSKVLNHASDGTGVTAIYNRYGYEVEKRYALEAWGQRLESIIRPADDEKVVPLRPGAG